MASVTRDEVGFWDRLETHFGYTQPAGIIKESVEAIFADTEGTEDEEFEAIAIDAAVRIAGNMIMAEKFGAACEVAVKSKEAIEAACKSSIRHRSTDVDGDPGDAHARASFITYNMAIDYGFSHQAAQAIAAVKICPRDFREVRNAPKRGDHVINNGVRKVFGKTIEDFWSYHKDKFDHKQVKELFDEKHRIFQMSLNKSFSETVDEFIEKTTVHKPRGESHQDTNDKHYGEWSCLFRIVVHIYMSAIFLDLVKDTDNQEVRDEFGADITICVDTINNVNRVCDKEFEVYVDSQAYKWWLAEHKGIQKQKAVEKCRKARAAVAELFSEFRPGENSLCKTIAEEFYEVYRRLHNIPT